MHKNFAGIYYEQTASIATAGWPSEEYLGREFQTAFNRFSIADRDLRTAKAKEWPAYLASGLPTIKSFEHAYTRLEIFSLNDANILVRASVSHPLQTNIELSVTFNPLMSHSQVGRQLMDLIQFYKSQNLETQSS